MSGNPYQLPTPPQIPGIPPLFPFPTIGNQNPQGQTFNQGEFSVLQQLADSLTSTPTPTLQKGAQDVFAAEAFLFQNNTTLLQLVQNLGTIVTNPQGFVNSSFSSGLTTSSSSGLPQSIYTALGSPNNSPPTLLVTTNPGTSVATNIGQGIGVGKATGVNTASNPVSGGSAFLSTFSIPKGVQPFLNALAGMNPLSPPTNDFFTALNGLINFYYQNLSSSSGSSLTGLQNVLSAFNQAGLFSNSLNTTGITYFFPLQSGNTFPQFIQSLLTLTTQPATVLAELILSPPSGGSSSPPAQAQLSVSGAIYQFLNSQTGGSQGTAAQNFLRPFVNVLFGVNPTTSNSNDPFDILLSLVLTGPTSFIKNIFSTTIASKGSISPQQLIVDMISNPTSVPSDIQQLITPGFQGFFEALFPTTLGGNAFSGSSNPNQLFIDMFTNPINVPSDLMSLISTGSVLQIFNGVTSSLPFWSQITGLFQNIANIAQTGFLGFPQSNLNGFGDSVTKGTNGYSSTAPGPLSPINGTLQGDLGFAAMCAATAYNEMSLLFSNVSSGSLPSASSDIKRLLDAPRFLASGLTVALAYIMQIMGALQNINNVLNNAGIPTKPGSVPFLPKNLGG